MLREDDRPPARLAAPRDLTRLVADLPPGRVDWRLTGDPAALAGAAGEAAYRITQEAVTNALRHGRGVIEARVDIGDRVVVHVANDIAPQSIRRGIGRGVAGMSERAALVGGRVSAGPEGGRWIVRGDLPAGEPS